MKHRSTRLTIRNISRHDLSRYECVAENEILPSVSKKFSLTINCKLKTFKFESAKIIITFLINKCIYIYFCKT